MPGDIERFESFYLGSRQRVLGCVYMATGDLGEAQDAVQEAYVRAWQRWRRFDRGSDPEAWVRLVATRIAISRWRSLRSRARAYLRHGVSAAVPPPDPDRVDLVAAMRRLSPDQRMAIALHYFGGMSVAEVAEQTGAPTGTIKARLARGRAALAPYLAGPTEGEAGV
ncbi:SigE family RNA polymerase sigma factor [Virgisporangium ochraceum]|uniref:RNA polymerase sigma24 factor n=1 Tax=Virgisporangium ochraceum TaxID=65505 RepID=A0A8J4A2C7_9ACTN|nr:SigE family RNA polymerase sigma factor [Virgisporangium ochraceum]GIJ72570.1 RNA polymerase sigma24 factor [Virgisporangium ochraceum]